MIHLMFITNKPWVAKIAENAGVDWIFIDMEWIGKEARQNGLDTVQNHHTFNDICKVKQVLTKSKVIVRINPIHNELTNYPSSKDEINKAIDSGADILMLPYFKTLNEVQFFINTVAGRVKTCLLLETPEAANIIDKIVSIPGIDMIHIGLNDMHLALKKRFMFELLSDGSVDKWIKIIESKGIEAGFGGLASLSKGIIPGNMILTEHYRLHSSMVILSRTFCNTDNVTDPEIVNKTFQIGISEIRNLETFLSEADSSYFITNRQLVIEKIQKFIQNS